MKVRKLQSDWKPSENPGLQVGETIHITNPRQLILDKKCIAIGENGEELDAFDLYGVVDSNLVNELKSFKNAKHQEQIKKNLEKEKVILEKELQDIKDKNAKKTKAISYDKMPWKELRQAAINADVFKPAMKKPEIIAALVEKES